MMEMMKLKQTLNDVLVENGIFSNIALLNKLNWFSLADSKNLDIEYYLNHSGEKYISPIFEKLYVNLPKVAEIIVLKYGDQWTRLYQAYILESYNPIENYSMTENEKVSSKVVNQRTTSTGSYGFNSSDAVPTDEGAETNTTSGNKDDNQRELTRKGNIGVTTSQQMLQSEIDLRKWSFYDRMMLDVDHVLTLNIYGKDECYD